MKWNLGKRKTFVNIGLVLIFGTVGVWIAAELYGLPAASSPAVTEQDAMSKWTIPTMASAALSGRCITDYREWAKMPDGQKKVAKLAQWKKQYGSLNFHDNCRGEPRQLSAAEASQ
jgi:hypothetical protein